MITCSPGALQVGLPGRGASAAPGFMAGASLTDQPAAYLGHSDRCCSLGQKTDGDSSGELPGHLWCGGRRAALPPLHCPMVVPRSPSWGTRKVWGALLPWHTLPSPLDASAAALAVLPPALPAAGGTVTICLWEARLAPGRRPGRTGRCTEENVHSAASCSHMFLFNIHAPK